MAARQEKLQSKFKLDKLMKNIDHENEKRQERIESLQKSIINKQEAGDEEKKEVSSALRTLRINYDQIHQKVMEKDGELELLRVSSDLILLPVSNPYQPIKRHVTNFTLFALIERR